MKDEHCEKDLGCDEEFTTENYKIKTCPLKEYEISTGQRDCPESEMNDLEGNKVRKLKSLDELKKLPLAATLVILEVLAVVRILCARFIFSPLSMDGFPGAVLGTHVSGSMVHFFFTP